MALYLGINGCGIDSQAKPTLFVGENSLERKKKGGLWGKSPCVTLFHKAMGEKKD